MEDKPGAEMTEVIELIKQHNKNLDGILAQEPSVDRAILILSMAAAVDCMDWTDPKEAMDICFETIDTVGAIAGTTVGKCLVGSAPLEFKGPIEPETDDWNGMFMDGQDLFKDILMMHIEAMGADRIEDAYKDTTLCLVYMIVIACIRSTDPAAASGFAKDSIKKTYDFIKEHCKYVEKKD